MSGGGSGRWSGPGRVYGMAYTNGGENFYKIGCTAEIQTNVCEKYEETKKITISGWLGLLKRMKCVVLKQLPNKLQ